MPALVIIFIAGVIFFVYLKNTSIFEHENATIIPTDMKLLKLRDDFNLYIEGWMDYYKKKGHRLALYTKDLSIDRNRTIYKAVYIDTYTKEKVTIVKRYI